MKSLISPISSNVTSLVPETINNNTFFAPVILLSFNKGESNALTIALLALEVPSSLAELQKRAEERRQKMKGFNYKFTDQMNKNIDEIERQPAYKRLGVI